MAQPQTDDNDIDIEALEEHIQASIADDEPEAVEAAEADTTTDEVVEKADEPVFNLDEALNSDTPVALANHLTDDQAKEEASKRGWNEDGADRFGHKISAIEFLERTPLFNKINLMRGDIDAQNKRIEKLAEQSKKIAQSKIESDKQHREALKAQKEELMNKEFLDSDDILEVRKLDKQIETAPVVAENTQDEQIVNDYESAKEVFKSENEWYGANRAMTALADKEGVEFAQSYYKEHGELPAPEVTFNYVLDEVKKDFPDMGKVQRQTRVANTRNRTVTTTHRKTKTLADLPDDMARSVAKEVMESAGISEEDYLSTYEF